ncbi:hypothetical protein ACTHRK_18575 [Dietzia cercidiphylli]|uniref:hypothetical protein n=1 Tax=Dietzia cercidiphylli TaxID=498199 RepID=UPI003F7EA56D
MRINRTLLASASLLATVGCSALGAENEESKGTKSHSLNVLITDSGRLDVYFNLDGHSCTSSSFSAAFMGETSRPVEVVVKNSSGSIVAQETAPEIGGEFKDRCTVPVMMTVPQDDFYEVTVTGGNPQLVRSKVFERSESSPQDVEIDF